MSKTRQWRVSRPPCSKHGMLPLVAIWGRIPTPAPAKPRPARIKTGSQAPTSYYPFSAPWRAGAAFAEAVAPATMCLAQTRPDPGRSLPAALPLPLGPRARAGERLDARHGRELFRQSHRIPGVLLHGQPKSVWQADRGAEACAWACGLA